jgi:hypothetical protein
MINTAGGLPTGRINSICSVSPLGVMVPAAKSMRDDGDTAGFLPVEVPASVRSANRDRLRGLKSRFEGTRSAVLAIWPCSADTTTPTSHKKAGLAASTPTGYPNGSHPAGSTKTNNPTSTPASNASTPNSYSTATNDDEHPQRHD